MYMRAMSLHCCMISVNMRVCHYTLLGRYVCMYECKDARRVLGRQLRVKYGVRVRDECRSAAISVHKQTTNFPSDRIVQAHFRAAPVSTTRGCSARRLLGFV